VTVQLTTDAGRYVTVERRGAVAIIWFDDHKANILSEANIATLCDTFRSLPSDVGAVVLAGKPGVFCGGLDLKVMRGDDPAAIEHLMGSAQRLFKVMFDTPVPIVAACTGHALAGGALLLLAADLRVGAHGDYAIGVIEVELGVELATFGFSMVERRLDRRFLVRASVLAERFSPADSVDCGFLDELADDPIARAIEHATRLSVFDRAVVGAMKQRAFGPVFRP
jgi:enoyl-CoA hydratase